MLQSQPRDLKTWMIA